MDNLKPAAESNNKELPEPSMDMLTLDSDEVATTVVIQERPTQSQPLRPTFDPGSIVQGRFAFELVRPLREGGMGSVFLANSSADAREFSIPEQVAIKFFCPQAGMDPAVLLKRELSALLALRHNRIPAVHDWRMEPPHAFAAFKYYAEGSLHDELKAGPLPVGKVWRLLIDLLNALTAAHRACILHLDIKPANVLLDGHGGYLLSDFGISQGSLVGRTVISTGLGAPVFQSPEQRRFDHDAFDVRTDLWGIGITVWAAAAGISPLQIRELQTQHLKAKCGVPSLTTLRPDFPKELADLIQELVGNHPDDRPGSSAEVLSRARNLGDTGYASAMMTAPVPAPLEDGESVRRNAIYDNVMDPLWASICRTGTVDQYLTCYNDGMCLCSEDEESYQAFVLLQGVVRVERRGRLLAREDRVGTFLGEITTLAGSRRTATLTAESDVWVLALKAAQLERFVSTNPAVSIRLMKKLAERIQHESALNAELQQALADRDTQSKAVAQL